MGMTGHRPQSPLSPRRPPPRLSLPLSLSLSLSLSLYLSLSLLLSLSSSLSLSLYLSTSLFPSRFLSLPLSSSLILSLSLSPSLFLCASPLQLFLFFLFFLFSLSLSHESSCFLHLCPPPLCGAISLQAKHSTCLVKLSCRTRVNCEPRYGTSSGRRSQLRGERCAEDTTDTFFE